jgi:hypothetical protein
VQWLADAFNGWDKLLQFAQNSGFAAAFTSMWSGVKSVWGDVKSFFLEVANAIIDIINGLFKLLDLVHISVPSFHIPGTNLTVGGGSIGFDLKDLPHLGMPDTAGTGGGGIMQKLAEGGIVMPTPGGQVVRVAEAGKAEAVIPLDKLSTLLNGPARVGQFGKGNTFNIVGQSDPVATAHATANRFAARGV